MFAANFCSEFKKIFNPTTNFSRKLQLGNFLVSLAALKQVYEKHRMECGIRFTDLLDSRNKQNVPPIQRMTSEVMCDFSFMSRLLSQKFVYFCDLQKATRCIATLDEYAMLHKGTKVYLEMCREFHDAFASKDLSLSKRIEKLAYVVFFMRIWNVWLNIKKAEPQSFLSRDVNGISYQACCDLEICVGAFCTVVAILADNPQFQHVKFPFDPQRMVCHALVVRYGL
jgi:hypothetical protein